MTDNEHIKSEACPRCILCGSEGASLYRGLQDRLFGASGAWDLKNCPSTECGLVWLDPMPVKEELWKAYASYYTHAAQSIPGQPGLLKRFYRAVKQGYVAAKYGYPSGSNPRLARILGTLLYGMPVHRSEVDTGIRFLRAVPGGRVLDVGCGAGEWLVTMRELGWQAEGVDFDPNAVKVAQLNGLDVRCGNLEEQNYAANSFDAVTLNHVIEHVPDPIGLLRECLRVLKPKGKLVLATPNIASLGHRCFKEYWRGLEPPRHLHVMSPAAMRRLLSRAGFEQVTVRTHSAHYVWYHSYRLWLDRKNPNSRRGTVQPAPLMPRLMTSIEQALLLFRPLWGECIGAVAVKR